MISLPLVSLPGEAAPEEVLRRPPREGLECLLMKMGRTRPLDEPRPRPQAGKSGYPRSQNGDSIPRAQGTLKLGFEAKPKGMCGAPRALTACGLGRRMAIDGTWVPPLPHAASTTALG